MSAAAEIWGPLNTPFLRCKKPERRNPKSLKAVGAYGHSLHKTCLQMPTVPLLRISRPRLSGRSLIASHMQRGYIISAPKRREVG